MLRKGYLQRLASRTPRWRILQKKRALLKLLCTRTLRARRTSTWQSLTGPCSPLRKNTIKQLQYDAGEFQVVCQIKKKEAFTSDEPYVRYKELLTENKYDKDELYKHIVQICVLFSQVKHKIFDVAKKSNLSLINEINYDDKLQKFLTI